MSCEFLGTKIMAPYYGISLHVWTAVIGITMLSLSIGYFIGGVLSEKLNEYKLIFYAFFCGSLFIFIMPLIVSKIILATFDQGLYVSLILSTFILLFPPLICFSMVNPVIIKLLVKNTELSGKITGEIYAIATIGSIITALLLGFYVIPELGIRSTVILTVISILLFELFFLYKFFPFKKHIMQYILTITLFLSTFIPFHHSKLDNKHKIIYESDGILGRLTVLDHYHGRSKRIVYVNGVSQSNIDIETGFSNSLYVHTFAAAASAKPRGSKALILGMGGGSLVTEFNELGFQTDICELDKRMAEISEKHFNVLIPPKSLFIDDARHFIKTCKKKYDIVVFDISRAEVQPSHIFTIEGFYELKNLLRDENSFVLLNYTDHSNDVMAFRSIYKTIQEAGYTVMSFASQDDTKLLMALPTQKLKERFKSVNLNVCCKIAASNNNLLAMKSIDTQNALLLKDGLPQLDVLNHETIKYYRNISLYTQYRHFIEAD